MIPTPSPPPPLEVDEGFVVASGIECSAPVVDGRRVDELVKTDHVGRFRDDFRLAAELGLRYLRYGIPFHTVNPAPGRFEWAWVDGALAACRATGLTPIVDLMHFGVPDDVRGYQDPELVERFTAYVRAFAGRYPWVRYYTPVNEPFITALFSARLGWWNEQRTDERSFVRALLNVARCVVTGAAEIRAYRPDAVLIQSESCQYAHPVDGDARERAVLENELRFASFELPFGRPVTYEVRTHLIALGVGPDEIAWFERNGTDAGWIVGNDYYEGSEIEIDAEGRMRPCGVRLGYRELAHQYHDRLGRPIMHTETNMDGERAGEWLASQWADVSRLRDEGFPIRGFTWYGLVNHVDWDSGLRRDDGLENACGLVGLDRRPNPRYAQFRTIALAELARLRKATTAIP